MSFNFAPWALDGAPVDSAGARAATFASAGPVDGIVGRADLKVSQLAVAGQGVQISAGNLLVLNRYQTVVNETYVVANPDVHVVPASAMPGSVSVAKSYLVLVTIGDPEFSQQGHPWMTSADLTVEQAAEFEYVRVIVVEVPAGTTNFSQLNLRYPAYALARLDIPANTTAINNGMITDLRSMAKPRVTEELYMVDASASNPLDTVQPSWEAFADNAPVVSVPSWATRAKIQAYVESINLSKSCYGWFRVAVVGTATATTRRAFNQSTPANGVDCFGMNFGGTVDVSTISGTDKTFRIEGQAGDTASKSGLTASTQTHSMIRIRFEEAPI